jgi:hypothetical protein
VGEQGDGTFYWAASMYEQQRLDMSNKGRRSITGHTRQVDSKAGPLQANGPGHS